MANCADDLTQVDYDASAAANSHLAGTSSTSSNNSLFPLIDFTHSHALNIDSNDPDNALKRVLRPLDSRDTVLDNGQVIGTVHAEGGVYTAGSIETQDGDDELLIHVSLSPVPSRASSSELESAHETHVAACRSGSLNSSE